MHDRVAGALAERIRASPISLLETYPGEIYPVDNCAVAATVALHPAADPALLARWKADLRRRQVDPASGLLIQAVTPSSAPFGGVREYPAAHRRGRGDIDSGPVIAGIGVSATGFSIAAARGLGDRRWFTQLHRTTWLFGAPVSTGEGRRFVTGGSLGNAILLAMLTAPRGIRDRPPPPHRVLAATSVAATSVAAIGHALLLTGLAADEAVPVLVAAGPGAAGAAAELGLLMLLRTALILLAPGLAAAAAVLALTRPGPPPKR
jgi:hypothetical protein